jgi:shikimate kinase
LTATGSTSEIEETLAKRTPLYQHAMDFFVDTDHRGVDEICDVIIENFKVMD